MNLSQEKIEQFQKKVFSFYQEQKRDLPWRKTTDPYKILLSEFMLQQTQVVRVVPFYTRWIAKWSTIHALASASRTEVLQLWMGLGYNTRAVHLHNAAQKIVEDFNGDVLKAMKHYEELPGIGRYTSHAVQIFSANDDLVTVDTNIRRIFIHEFQLSENVSDTVLWKLAEQCLPKGKSRDWHNALMDYGTLVVTSIKTGIKPKTQQNSFKGSDRQIRSQILRLLLKKDILVHDLYNLIHIEQPRLKKILEKMKKEDLIEMKKGLVHLHE